MSLTEIERFVTDVKADEDLMRELSEGALGVDELVERARSKGYRFSADEAKAFAEEQAPQELTEEQLQMAAGGRDQEYVAVAIALLILPSTINTVVVAPS